MKEVYPIIITHGKSHFFVYIPDFDINTQGNTIAEAMEMARDAIGLIGIDMQEDSIPLPAASSISDIECNKSEIITLIDVDFDEYRKKHEQRTVKKNCTLPSWLNYEAEKANINFSAVLQNALIEQLGIR